MLTIGQLATHAGVTIRAVRHYHQRGLLPEPERDSSGYRRYDAQAVVDLIRIKTLADAGVPLARIGELISAEPEEFAAAVTEIDQQLTRKIRELTQHRRSIAELAAGERLFVPPKIVAILDRLRELGHSERMIRIERDMWIMIVALSPQAVPEWVTTKNAALDDPAFQRLYLACDGALTWEPDDPRLDGLATAIAAWDADRQGHEQNPADAIALMYSHAAAVSPAWQRLITLLSTPPTS